MHIMSVAALAVEELTSLLGPCIQFADCLKEHLVKSRSILDSFMLVLQKQQVQSAMQPPLDYDTERSKLQPFQVYLNAQGAGCTKCPQQLRDECIKALAGVPAPPDLHAQASAWCRWLECMVSLHMQSWGGAMLCLQQVEQFFYACADRYLTHPCSSTCSSTHRGMMSTNPIFPGGNEVKKCVVLLKLYSRAVATVESRYTTWALTASPHVYPFSPMLLVQLRSLETLLTWIVMCLIHQRVEHEWQGIARYKLPVEADDLRHLVRGGNSAAQHAVTTAAEYICSIAERSSEHAGRVCFSMESEDTFECVAEYASVLSSCSLPKVFQQVC